MFDLAKYKNAVFDICEEQLLNNEEYAKINNEYLAAERGFKQSLNDTQLKEYLRLESMAVNLSIIEKEYMCAILIK